MKAHFSVFSIVFLLLIFGINPCSGQEFPVDSVGNSAPVVNKLNYEDLRELLFICKARSVAQKDSRAIFSDYQDFRISALVFPKFNLRNTSLLYYNGWNKASMIERSDGNNVLWGFRKPDYKKMSEQYPEIGPWEGAGLILLQLIGGGLIDAAAYGFPRSK